MKSVAQLFESSCQVFWLKLSRVLRFGLFPLFQLLSVARSWCARDGSRWTSLPDGFRFSGGHVRSQCSGQRPEIVSNQHQWEFSGRWRQPKSAQGEPPVRPRPRVNPDVAREMAHTKVSKLGKALEAMGDLQGPVVDVLKADLAKARAASKKPSVEVEIGECRKFISRAERRIKELDTEREKERVSLVEAQERLERQVPRDPRHSPRVTSDRAPTNGQFVAVRARCFGERVDSSQVHHLGGSQTIHPAVKKQAVSRQASSRRDTHGRIPLMPCHVPNDITNWLEDRQADFQEALAQGDLRRSSRIVQDVVRRSTPLDGVVFAPTIICGQHGDVNFQGDHCLHQCGYLGCRVGEASNPGPVQTRQARRVEHDQVIADTAQDSVSTTRRRRRRLRPLPWSWDSDSDLTDQCSRRSGHRGHVQSHKWTHLTKILLSAPTVACVWHQGTDAELPATVPASPGALFATGLLPEHEFPTSDTQHNRMLVFRRRTVGEVESTVPATPLAIAAVGMAPSASRILTTQLDSSGIEDDRNPGPGRLTRPVEGRDERPRRDHQRGLVVETAPNVVDATAVDLSSSPHDSVVDALELDLAVDEEFNGEERNDEEAAAVPWEEVVANGNGRPPSRRLRLIGASMDGLPHSRNMHDEVPSTVVASHVPAFHPLFQHRPQFFVRLIPTHLGGIRFCQTGLIRNQSIGWITQFLILWKVSSITDECQTQILIRRRAYSSLTRVCQTWKHFVRKLMSRKSRFHCPGGSP